MVYGDSFLPAAEMAPVAKVGGLGDVVTGLSKAMIDRGNVVETVLPYYKSLEKVRKNMKREYVIIWNMGVGWGWVGLETSNLL